MKTSLRLLALLVAMLSPQAQAGLFFWDLNGTAPDSGSATPTGTWSMDAASLTWNADGSGGGANGDPSSWVAGATAVFAAGNDAVGAYTITVAPNLQVADIHVDLGDVTFEGGPILLNDVFGNPTNRLLSVGHKDLILGISSVARYNMVLTGANGIIRYKRGTLIFGAVNTYTGPTTVEGGILQLGVDNAIPTNSDFILSNNAGRSDVFPTNSFTPASLVLDGYNQALGTLDLTGPDAPTPRTIDFGGGVAALTFADSSANSWTDNNSAPIYLLIVNYKPGLNVLRFGTNASGLTQNQLAHIRFVDLAQLSGKIDGNGFVIPGIAVARPNPSQTDLTWAPIIGRTYRVQYKDSLTDPGWTDFVPDIYATTPTITYSDSTASGAFRYYRILELP